MKAVVDRNEFAEALRKAGRALSMKTVGTLNGYRISFRSDGKSYITGTSGICRVRALFEADVETEFEIVVAQEVCEIASRLAGADIAIEESGDELNIRSGKTRVKIPVLEVEPPDYRTAYGEGGFEAEALAAAVHGVEHALAPEAAQNVMLTSIKLNISNDGLRMEALDGIRIAVRGEAEGNELLIPGAAMKVAASLFKGAVKVEYTDDVVTFSDKDTIMDCSRNQFKAFNTSKILADTDVIADISFNRMELMQAIQLVMVITTNESAKKIWMMVENGTVSLSSSTRKGGIDTDLDASINGDTILSPILLNGKFLLEALKSVEDDEIVLEFRGCKAPIIMRGEGYVELILPCYPNA